MKTFNGLRLYDKAWRAAWALFLVTLPVTSFPFFPPAIGGGALVRPLSMYPLFVLLILVTLPRLWTRRLPKTFISLAPFVILALVTSLLSLVRGIDPALGITTGERVSRALITLMVGLAFYVTVAVTPETPQDLRFSLRWLYAGFTLALVWGAIQAVNVIHFMPPFFQWLSRIQSFISVRRLFTNRVSGMTYEPNWFAVQLTFVLLPWLLSSVLSGVSAFKWRWHRLTLEWFLLAMTIAVLPFTYSRSGLLNLAVLVFFGLAFFRPRSIGQQAKAVVRWKGILRNVVLACAVLAILGAMVYLAGKRNVFFARLWGYWARNNATLEGYFEYIGFGARFTYGETAYNIYRAYPIFGVGLGNYAFYFEQMLPDQPLASMPEVLRLVTPDATRNRLITAKNFYFRLLAETGLVGTVAFVAFLMAVLSSAIFLYLSAQPEQRYWGMAGLFGLVMFVLAALSFDSFAVPNMWIVLGFITASTSVYHLDGRGEPTQSGDAGQ